MEDSNTTRIHPKAKIEARILSSASTGSRARDAFVDLACVRNESFRERTTKKLHKTKFVLVYKINLVAIVRDFILPGHPAVPGTRATPATCTPA